MRSTTASPFGVRARRGQELCADGCVLSGDSDHQQHGQDCQQCEPAESRLPSWDNDEGREQWAERSADLASDLEDSLCQALSIAGSISRHARCFRMVDRGAYADTSNREEDYDVVCREGEAY